MDWLIKSRIHRMVVVWEVWSAKWNVGHFVWISFESPWTTFFSKGFCDTDFFQLLQLSEKNTLLTGCPTVKNFQVIWRDHPPTTCERNLRANRHKPQNTGRHNQIICRWLMPVTVFSFENPNKCHFSHRAVRFYTRHWDPVAPLPCLL